MKDTQNKQEIEIEILEEIEDSEWELEVESLDLDDEHPEDSEWELEIQTSGLEELQGERLEAETAQSNEEAKV